MKDLHKSRNDPSDSLEVDALLSRWQLISCADLVKFREINRSLWLANTLAAEDQRPYLKKIFDCGGRGLQQYWQLWRLKADEEFRHRWVSPVGDTNEGKPRFSVHRENT